MPAALAVAFVICAVFARPSYAAAGTEYAHAALTGGQNVTDPAPTANAQAATDPAVSETGQAQESGSVREGGSARESSETKAPDRGTQTAAGTTILIGAGVYTYARGKWKENRESSGKKEPVYFENNTRTGVLRSSERENDI